MTLANDVAEKRATIQETVDLLTVNLSKLADVLNVLCNNMAGAATDPIPDPPNAPLLFRLVELTDRTKYCLDRAETICAIMGGK